MESSARTFPSLNFVNFSWSKDPIKSALPSKKSAKTLQILQPFAPQIVREWTNLRFRNSRPGSSLSTQWSWFVCLDWSFACACFPYSRFLASQSARGSLSRVKKEVQPPRSTWLFFWSRSGRRGQGQAGQILQGSFSAKRGKFEQLKHLVKGLAGIYKTIPTSLSLVVMFSKMFVAFLQIQRNFTQFQRRT